MNIDDNFNSASHYLEVAKEQVAMQDYENSLSSLSQAYSHTRALLEQVFKLQALKVHVSDQNGG